MLFALGHEDTVLKRAPVVTLILLGLCILIWAAMRYISDKNGGQMAINNAVYFYDQYPQLTVPKDLETLFEYKLANKDLTETKMEKFGKQAEKMGQWFFMDRFSRVQIPVNQEIEPEAYEEIEPEAYEEAEPETDGSEFDAAPGLDDQPTLEDRWKYRREHPVKPRPRPKPRSQIEEFNRLAEPWEEASESDPKAGQQDQPHDESIPHDKNAVAISESASSSEIEQKFDSLVERVRSTETYWFRKWGVVGGEFNSASSITYMFLHVGFAHLFFNMLFLYLFGPSLEDRFGHIFTVGFFLISGFLASTMQFLLSPLADPTIGASGVVSAILGAYLLNHPNSKVSLMIYFVPVPIKFPAWVLVLLFFIVALFSSLYMSDLSKVAYWVYVGGFFFGLIIMFVIRNTGLNDLFWPEVMEFSGNLIIDAYKFEKNGDIKRAMGLIKDGLEVNEDDPDLLRVYWVMTKTHLPISEIVTNANRVIQYSTKFEPQSGYECYRECLELDPKARLSPILLLKLSQALIKEDWKQQALEILTQVWTQLDSFTSKILLTIMEQAVATEAPFTDDVAAKLRSLSDSGEEGQLSQLETLPENSAAVLAVEPGSQSLSLENPFALEALAKNTTALRVLEAVPLQLTESGLVLRVADKERNIPAIQIKHLCAGAIREPDAKPYLILDLVIDSLAEALPQHRVLRITSKEFNPLSLFPEAANPGEGFRKFVEFILATSEAEPLPSRSATLGMPYAKFSSVASFEQIYFD